MDKNFEDITFEEWEAYYKKECKWNCDKECEACDYHIGSCCLGDIIGTGNKKETLRSVLEDKGVYFYGD